MDRLISEKSVMEVIYGCDYFIDEAHAEIIKERIKAIPSAEPYEGMTNGEVVKTVFPDIALYTKNHKAIEITFDGVWWNSPYKGEQE